MEAAGADLIHVDVMDGHFVPELTFGPAVVRALRPHTGLPLDVHLMVEPAEAAVEAFATAGADLITVHIEACPHLDRTLRRIRELGKKAGVALNPGTSERLLEPSLGICDLVLVMTVNPGYGGQTFLTDQGAEDQGTSRAHRRAIATGGAERGRRRESGYRAAGDRGRRRHPGGRGRRVPGRPGAVSRQPGRTAARRKHRVIGGGDSRNPHRSIPAWRAAVYRSSLWRIWLRRRGRETVIRHAEDAVPGDAKRGDALFTGSYAFQGETLVSRTEPVWEPDGFSAAWQEELHGFLWIRDLRAAGDELASLHARKLIDSWLEAYADWHPEFWRIDILGNRIAAWLLHARFSAEAGRTTRSASASVRR